MMSNNSVESGVDGVCFFCGSYADSLAVHETKVHGSNRVRENEVY